MRNYLGILLLILLLTACGAKKNLYQGSYDTAIRKAVSKLQKKPDNIKYMDVLIEAYTQANARDKDQIIFLKKEGKPDSWDRIFSLYNSMDRRQKMVKRLSFVPNGISFTNYDEEIINAKKKAAEYYYSKGKQLLDQKTRESARSAYVNFNNVKRFYSNYRDVDNLIQQAKQEGTKNVEFQIQNVTQLILPKGFENELKKITLRELEQDWIHYSVGNEKNLFYDYTILLKMTNILVSPERERESNYTEKKTIKDGWKYELDENGNVKKDTAGNDIKVDKYTEIECVITEIQQFKSAKITGTLDYIDNRSKQLIKSIPVASETVFEHIYASATGNLAALTKASKKKISRKPLPFPLDEEIILDASVTLKNITKDILNQNKAILN